MTRRRKAQLQEGRDSEKLTPPRWGLLTAVAVVLVVVAVATLVVFTLGWWLLGRPARPKQLNSAQWLDAIKVGLALVAGLGAAVGLTVSYRRQRTEEARHQAEQAKELGDRYTAAAEMLGHDKSAVRLAGVVALARLADDWPAHRQTCIDVLCAYLRMPYDPKTAEPGEREARLSIIRTIRDHLLPAAPASTSWQGRNLDFTGATFDGGDFRGAMFSGGRVNFHSAEFSGGTVTFAGATFSGGRVAFDSAEFSGGTVTFAGAMFSGGRVNFHSAEFSGGRVDFADARFSGGRVDFSAVRSWEVPPVNLPPAASGLSLPSRPAPT